MIKHLLAGVAAVVLMSGIAAAQIYPPAPPPPPVAPPVPVPGPGISAPMVAPMPDDTNGSQVIKKDIYREGVEGSSETHTKTETDPLTGSTTTRSKTTTSPHE